MSLSGWKAEAACLDDPGAHWDGELLPSMFTLCMGCPVRHDCLLEALDRDWRVDCGVWGGTDEFQRRAIRRGTYTIEDAWRGSAKQFAAGT
jgi:WhiB family redox-sensing transcriptional regulator